MNSVNNYVTGIVSAAIGAGSIGFGNWLLSKSNLWTNSGLEQISKVMDHVEPNILTSVNFVLEAVFTRSTKGIQQAIKQQFENGFYTQRTVDELNGFLSKGLQETALGDSAVYAAQLSVFIGAGLCLYGAYKLASAAIQHFRGNE